MQDVESDSHIVLLLRSATADPEKEKGKFLCVQLGRKYRWVPRRVFFGGSPQLVVRMKRKIRMFLACFSRIYCMFLLVLFFFFFS